MLRRVVLTLCAVATLLAAATCAQAHPMSPALLQITEKGEGVFSITWRQSIFKLPGTMDKKPTLPPGCETTTAPTLEEDSVASTTAWEVNCGPEGLVGQTVGIQGLGEAGTDGLVRIEMADGRVIRRVVSEENPELVVPGSESWLSVGLDYAWLGIEHILGGYDHLLFVFGLFLLVPALRPLAVTVTAFTLGHSVTLTLAVLGAANASPAIVEPIIAFTVYLLAVEIARRRHANPSLLSRYPWAMALLFGLLHGLGFAGALREVGLPQNEIPLALFSFNVGIEIGQLAFLVVVLVLRTALAGFLAGLPAWTRVVPVYAMGSLAAMWMFERIAPLLAT